MQGPVDGFSFLSQEEGYSVSVFNRRVGDQLCVLGETLPVQDELGREKCVWTEASEQPWTKVAVAWPGLGGQLWGKMKRLESTLRESNTRWIRSGLEWGELVSRRPAPWAAERECLALSELASLEGSGAEEEEPRLDSVSRSLAKGTWVRHTALLAPRVLDFGDNNNTDFAFFNDYKNEWCPAQRLESERR
jgi:hypothetical protein